MVQLDGVLQAKSPAGLWLPTEPLLDPDSGAGSDDEIDCSVGRLFGSRPQVRADVRQICTDAMSQSLNEVFAFIQIHGVDVAVLPEYQIPLEYLPKLVGFSHECAIVAGLGFVMNAADAARLLAVAERSGWQESDLVHRNVSVLVESGRVHLVTKQNIAGGEAAEPGRGYIVRDLTMRGGRRVKLGVAVCLDYVILDGNIAKERADIVCIPANTRVVGPFVPDQPRDHVRLLANTAANGGSQIFLPALSGPLVNDRGVRAIDAAYQGVIIVEYDGYPTRPTAQVGPTNRLVVRAELVERGPAADELLAMVDDFAARGPCTSANRPEQLERWINKIGSSGPLAQALIEYDQALAQGFDADQTLHDLAFTHLAIEQGRRRDTIRGRQARLIIDRLPELGTYGSRLPLGKAKDHYERLAQALCPEVDGSLTPDRSSHSTEHALTHAAGTYPGLVRYTQSTARDGTRSETLEISDPTLAEQFLARFQSDPQRDY